MRTRPLIVVLAIITAVLAWHAISSQRLRSTITSIARDTDRMTAGMANPKPAFTVAVNPWNNVVDVTLASPLVTHETWNDQARPFLESLVSTLGPRVFEKKLAAHAHDQFDLYAMLVPYKLRIHYNDVAVE